MRFAPKKRFYALVFIINIDGAAAFFGGVRRNKMESKFFAFLSRMKYIDRWELMRSQVSENDAEHSLQVAWVAHALGVIENKYYGGKFNPDRLGMIGAYHEAGEVVTGDMPSPIKYFSPEIMSAYKSIERQAEKKIVELLPEELRPDFASFFEASEEEKRLVKCADKLCAYIKCVEEVSVGNGEFKKAKRSIEKELRSFEPKSVQYFMDTFIPAFALTLDELSVE